MKKHLNKPPVKPLNRAPAGWSMHHSQVQILSSDKQELLKVERGDDLVFLEPGSKTDLPGQKFFANLTPET